MKRDNLFTPRRHFLSTWRFFVLLGLVCAPAYALLRSHTRHGRPLVETQVVVEVSVDSAPAPSPPTLSAQSALLMDAATGTILYQKAAHTRRPMASTTKIMTALLVLEHGQLADVVTASEHAVNTPHTGLYLRKGEQVTQEDLLWAILLRSANDACVASAEHVAGSEEAFVALMNAKAQELGMKDTHFVNPHGLHHPDHYSSAYDLGILARYAMNHPLFAEIVGRKRRRIQRSMEKQDVVLVNKNRLLFLWNLADGVKTGYTRQAGHCLVASASQEGWRLIAVVLKSNNAFADSRALLEYGFHGYQQVKVPKEEAPVAAVPVVNGTQETVPAIPDHPITLVAPRAARVEQQMHLRVGKMRAPILCGDWVGTLVVRRNGAEAERAPLVAASVVGKANRPLVPRWVLGACALLVLFSLRRVAHHGRKTAQGARRRRSRFSP